MKGVRLSPYFAEWRSLPCCCCWPILTPNLPCPLPGQAAICHPHLLPDALSDLSVTPIDAGGQQTAELQGQGTSDKPCDTPLLQCLPPPLCCITVLRYCIVSATGHSRAGVAGRWEGNFSPWENPSGRPGRACAGDRACPLSLPKASPDHLLPGNREEN